MSYPDLDTLTNYVSRIFRIDDVTAGNPREWIVRYRGQLLGDDSAAAYDRLAETVGPHGITPLFRKGDDGRQIIFLVPTMKNPRLSARAAINIALFFITFLSMMLTGVSPEAANPNGSILGWLRYIFSGWPFAVSLMGILFAHEMGHYIACKIYKVPATLPFFIPSFLPPFGTLGAFIMMRGIPKNKRVLFDIGVAGPLAGLVVIVPVLLYGLSISPLTHITASMHGIMEGNSLFYLLSKYLVFRKLLPQPANFGGVSAFLYWIKYFFSGQPVPFGGLDVQLSSVAWAGWGGLLVTALNLMPVGTLDGGHVAYGLFGDKARRIFPIIIGLLIACSVLPAVLSFSFVTFNYSWILWGVILFWLGNVRTVPFDDITPLDPKRRMLGIFVLILFVLLFTPIPLTMY